MDGDGDIDFAEWRKELKARGYSDLEIETVFAKYDQDGDKVTLPFICCICTCWGSFDATLTPAIDLLFDRCSTLRSAAR